MKIKLFEELPLTKKLEYVFSEGTFLTCRTVRECMIELFSVDEFFVEVWYSGMNDDDYVHLRLKTFRSISFIDAYLEEETSFMILKETQNITSI